MRFVTSVLVCSAISLAASCADRTDPPPAGTAVVLAVIDGDTIDVTIAGRTERVRLLGIDTPEIAHDAFTGRPANHAECLGDEASALTGRLIPAGTTVRLERDIVGRDDYGRLLAYVYRTNDGLFVNEHLVRTGLAVPLWITPNEVHRAAFTAAARAAEADDVGVWGSC